MLGWDFDIIVPETEAEFDTSLSPGAAVVKIALEKARSVAAGQAGRTILAADTVVWLDGRVLEKPENEREAFTMLRLLSGRSHSVFSGVVLKRGETELCGFEETSVCFRDLTDAEIREYISSGEPMDKAGAYGAQGRGALFISHIEGDYFNVVGLPLCRLGVMLKHLLGENMIRDDGI